MPINSLSHWFFPKSRLGAFIASPYVKFVNHAVSFVLFLLLLVTSSIDRMVSLQVSWAKRIMAPLSKHTEYYFISFCREWKPNRFEWVDIPTNHWFIPHQWEEQGRYCRLNWIEYALMLYIFGRLINEVKELWQQGPRDYWLRVSKLILDLLIRLIRSPCAQNVTTQKT